MSHGSFRFDALPLCCTFLAAVIVPHYLVAQKPKAIAGAEVDRSVVTALLPEGITKPRVVSHIDLSKLFGTVSQWTFVAVQDGGQSAESFEDHGPIGLCLVKDANPDCALNLYQQIRAEMRSFEKPYHLFAASIVYSKPKKENPLLFLKVCGAVSGDGDCKIATALYIYDKVTDRFIRVFLNLTGRNNNQGTRFVESGPLQGSVVVDNPTNKAPYTYWIEVYRAPAVQGSIAAFSAIVASPTTPMEIRWP